MKILRVIPLLIVVAAFVAGVVLYPSLPDSIASHWNASGQVDGYMGKLWGTFLFPLILAGLYLLFLAVPRIDPKRENIQKFRKYFDWFIVVTFAFFFSVYIVMLRWSLGHVDFQIGRFMSIGIAVIFFMAGVMAANSEPNWTIGIRTPWTLSSEHVWRETHRLGGRLFKIAAVICLGGAIFPAYAIWFVLVPVIVASVWSVVYSYVIYAREKRSGGLA